MKRLRRNSSPWTRSGLAVLADRPKEQRTGNSGCRQSGSQRERIGTVPPFWGGGLAICPKHAVGKRVEIRHHQIRRECDGQGCGTWARNQRRPAPRAGRPQQIPWMGSGQKYIPSRYTNFSCGGTVHFRGGLVSLDHARRYRALKELVQMRVPELLFERRHSGITQDG
jgi:hypothetical protein